MSKKVTGKTYVKNIDNRRNRRQSLIIVLSVFLCVVMVGVLVGCGTAVLKLDVTSVKNDSGEQVFNISLEDFIASFNGVYAKGNGTDAKGSNTGYLGAVDTMEIRIVPAR